MNDIENLIKYVKDHSNNFLGSKATLKEKETFEYMYDLLIETLEKQTPKKPIDSYNWEDLSEEERLETPRWYCKSCDGVIEEHYSYCALCSQAIDWSGEDE